MMLSKQDKLDLYRAFEKVYSSKVKVAGRFRWKPTEKQTLRVVFQHFNYVAQRENSCHFKEQLSIFEEYLGQQISKWLGWNKATRKNLFGFLKNTSKDDVPIFYATMNHANAVSKDIEGVKTDDQWGF